MSVNNALEVIKLLLLLLLSSLSSSSLLMLLHKNVAVQERICRGKALTKILPVYDESMKGGVDVFSIRIQELCQLSL